MLSNTCVEAAVVVIEGHSQVQELWASKFFLGKKNKESCYSGVFSLNSRKAEKDLSEAGLHKKSLPLWLKIY